MVAEDISYESSRSNNKSLRQPSLLTGQRREASPTPLTFPCRIVDQGVLRSMQTHGEFWRCPNTEAARNQL